NLTAQHEKKWEENKAELATLEAEAVRVAMKHKVEPRMLAHDLLTLDKRTALCGLALEELQECDGLHVMAASAGLGYFKLVDDLWSHGRGHFAMVLAGQVIAKTAAEWNQKRDEFAFLLAPAVEGGAAQAAAGGLSEEIRGKVTECARKHFSFAALPDGRADEERAGAQIHAEGPAISIGVSSALHRSGSDKVALHPGCLQADAALENAKHESKEGEDPGGGIIFADDLLQPTVREAAAAAKVFQDMRAAPDAHGEAAVALQSLAVDADNKRRAAAVLGAFEGLERPLGAAAPAAQGEAGELKNLQNGASALQNLAVDAGNRRSGPCLAADADNQSGIAAALGALGGLARLPGARAPAAQEKAAAEPARRRALGALGGLVRLLGAGAPMAQKHAAGALRARGQRRRQ
ncbi:unnamed protein product, partial [Prorocentrum cordatum]